MATYDTLGEVMHRFGRNSYLSLARKRLNEGGAQTEFLMLTRGCFDATGVPKWARFVTIPDSHEAICWLIRGLRAQLPPALAEQFRGPAPAPAAPAADEPEPAPAGASL